MLRWSIFAALIALAALSFSSPARAQDSVATLNQKALEAHTAGKYDEAIGYWTRVLEITPKDKGTAYNMACGHSRKGDIDKAIEWIERAGEWGWGAGQGTIAGDTRGQMSELEMIKQDADLENLRKDPRYAGVMEKLSKAVEARETARKKSEEYAASAAVYVPEKAKSAAEVPVLVVLHDQGSTKDEIVKGRWKAIADELGFALVAPSGKVVVSEDPAKGMKWFADRKEYTQRAWSFEKPVHDAVAAFKKDHAIDKNRVVVAGEGQGALVALNVAIGNPGLYKGAVALNGALDPELMATKASGAGKAGLKVRLLSDEASLKKFLADSGQKDAADPATAIAAWNKFLQTWGVSGEARSFVPVDAEPERLTKMLAEAVQAVLPAAAPAEAGAPK